MAVTRRGLSLALPVPQGSTCFTLTARGAQAGTVTRASCAGVGESQPDAVDAVSWSSACALGPPGELADPSGLPAWPPALTLTLTKAWRGDQEASAKKSGFTLVRIRRATQYRFNYSKNVEKPTILTLWQHR